MAEAASLALAFAVSHGLNLSGVHFLSDCEQLVHFLNKNDISNPPDWRVKCFTETFASYARGNLASIHKIHRHLNNTADAVARQALQTPSLQSATLEFTYCVEYHLPQCTVLRALQYISLTGVTIFAARCC
jgi:hypothetical protein